MKTFQNTEICENQFWPKWATFPQKKLLTEKSAGEFPKNQSQVYFYHLPLLWPNFSGMSLRFLFFLLFFVGCPYAFWCFGIFWRMSLRFLVFFLICEGCPYVFWCFGWFLKDVLMFFCVLGDFWRMSLRFFVFWVIFEGCPYVFLCFG